MRDYQRELLDQRLGLACPRHLNLTQPRNRRRQGRIVPLEILLAFGCHGQNLRTCA